MSHSIQIGRTTIPYTIRVSDKARKIKLVVRPDAVEVVSPQGTTLEAIEQFVHSKRQWLFKSIQDLKRQQVTEWTQHYGSGAKIQYRGRYLMIRWHLEDANEVSIQYSSKFEVTVPKNLSKYEQLKAVQAAFEAYLKHRALLVSKQMARRYERLLQVQSKNLIINQSKHNWGTCGKDNIIRINWQLIQAPTIAMQYVVAHEVTHLIHRNHSEEFWNTLGTALTNWQEGKQSLESWERAHLRV